MDPEVAIADFLSFGVPSASILVLAVWVFVDGDRRGMRVPGGWALGTLLLVFLFPLYLVRRPLKTGEVRRGGKVSLFFRNLAVLWTAFSVFSYLPYVLQPLLSTAPSSLKVIMVRPILADAALVWAIVVLPAVVVGLLFWRGSVLEEGPTGPLARAEEP